MNDDLTHVTTVLDASGSMNTIRDATIESFNEFFREQAGVEGEMSVSLYEFSGTPDDHFGSSDLTLDMGERKAIRRKFRERYLDDQVPELTKENYVPGGRTPLYDALIQAIDETGERLASLPEEERPANVIVFALTDGEENASVVGSDEEGAEEVRRRIERQQGVYDWEFLFVGANQDAVLEASKIGIDAQNAMTMDYSDEGTRSAVRSTSANVAAYRGSGDSDALSYDEDQRQSNG